MKLPLVVAPPLFAVVLGLAACSGSSTPAGGSSAEPSSTPPATTATTPSASSTSSPAASSSAGPVTSPSATAGSACATAQLTVTFEATQGAAGTEFSAVRFRNRSETACTLQGYPGVSLLDGRRQQIGQPATRVNGSGSTVRVAPGDVATATFGVAPAACQDGAPTSAFVRVFPPGERADVVLSAQVPVCRPTIRSVHAGTVASAD